MKSGLCYICPSLLSENGMAHLIQQIEDILQLKLHPAPDRDGDLLASVMAFKENQPKYALDAEKQLIGLNLAKTGLTDEKWEKILALPGLAEHLRALNLSENALTTFPFPPNNGLRKLESLRLAENQLKEFLLPPGMDAPTDFPVSTGEIEHLRCVSMLFD